MAKRYVVGVRNVKFTDKETGKLVDGKSLMYVRNLETEHEKTDCIGQVIEKIFVHRNDVLCNELDNLKFGTWYDFQYELIGRKSYLVKLTPCDKPVA